MKPTLFNACDLELARKTLRRAALERQNALESGQGGVGVELCEIDLCEGGDPPQRARDDRQALLDVLPRP